jgi:hypothetical protein
LQLVSDGRAPITRRTVNDYRGGEIRNDISNAFLQIIGADAPGSIDITEHEVRFLANVDDDGEGFLTP